jgi:hypothetical protein
VVPASRASNPITERNRSPGDLLREITNGS